YGSSDDVHYTYFDTRVVGKEAQRLIRAAMKHVEAKRKVLVGFNLGDLYVDPFTYKSGKHAGEQGYSLKARLLRVDWVKVDGKNVYTAPKPEAKEAAEGPKPEAKEAAKGSAGTATSGSSVDAEGIVDDLQTRPVDGPYRMTDQEAGIHDDVAF
ncbi:MAG: DUF3577 domain-containing protein, partial [Gammaproteobacteria bacterium]|nr:DUF3577 domain-containing protein [Gammaproteobacteria bacterium]